MVDRQTSVVLSSTYIQPEMQTNLTDDGTLELSAKIDGSQSEFKKLLVNVDAVLDHHEDSGVKDFRLVVHINTDSAFGDMKMSFDSYEELHDFVVASS